MVDIGDQLKIFFIQRGISQGQIAKTLGVKRPYISRLFNGSAAFGKKTAAKFEELYGLSAAWLLTGTGEMLKDHTAAPSVVTYGDNSPAAGNSQTVTHVGTPAPAVEQRDDEELERLRAEVERLRGEVERGREERLRLLSLMERMVGEGK